jgi:hypothetical protein
LETLKNRETDYKIQFFGWRNNFLECKVTKEDNFLECLWMEEYFEVNFTKEDNFLECLWMEEYFEVN